MKKKMVTCHYPFDFCPPEERDFLPGRLPEDWRIVTHTPWRAFYRSDGLRVIFSVSVERDRRRWMHLSLSREGSLPSWDDLVDVKIAFCGKERYAIQVIPPTSEYISDHDHCLHLWSCLDGHPLPDFRKMDENGRLSI